MGRSGGVPIPRLVSTVTWQPGAQETAAEEGDGRAARGARDSCPTFAGPSHVGQYYLSRQWAACLEYGPKMEGFACLHHYDPHGSGVVPIAGYRHVSTSNGKGRRRCALHRSVG